MPISVPVFRVFVSSTFGDLKAERRALHKRVFEPLRAMCASRDAEFQAIDLRWGVSAEAVADQRAVEICLREVARCRQVTRRPNFLLLLGDRYGARPLPSAIEGDSFRRVHVRLSEDDARIVDRWYLEDRNAVPSVFVLQPRRGPYQASDVWDEEERRVRSALLRAAAERPAEEAVLRLLRTSITEQLRSVDGRPPRRDLRHRRKPGDVVHGSGSRGMVPTSAPRAGAVHRGFPLGHCPGNWRGRQQRKAMGKQDWSAIGVSAMSRPGAQCRRAPPCSCRRRRRGRWTCLHCRGDRPQDRLVRPAAPHTPPPAPGPAPGRGGGQLGPCQPQVWQLATG